MSIKEILESVYPIHGGWWAFAKKLATAKVNDYKYVQFDGFMWMKW